MIQRVKSSNKLKNVVNKTSKIMNKSGNKKCGDK